MNKYELSEDKHKKSVFYVCLTTKVLPSLHQWLSGPCHLPVYHVWSLKGVGTSLVEVLNKLSLKCFKKENVNKFFFNHLKKN